MATEQIDESPALVICCLSTMLFSASLSETERGCASRFQVEDALSSVRVGIEAHALVGHDAARARTLEKNI